MAKFGTLAPFDPNPCQMIIDRRSLNCKKNDLAGIQAKTLNKEIGINVEPPEIVTSIPEGDDTKPSLTHHKHIGIIVLIMANP